MSANSVSSVVLFAILFRWLPSLVPSTSSAITLLLLPGTICHELAHYVAALISNGKPEPIRLNPVRTEAGWTLGSVRFVPRWYNRGLVGLAPLWMPVGLLALVSPLEANGMPVWQAMVLGAAFSSAAPSRADLQIAITGADTWAALALLTCWYVA